MTEDRKCKIALFVMGVELRERFQDDPDGADRAMAADAGFLNGSGESKTVLLRFLAKQLLITTDSWMNKDGLLPGELAYRWLMHRFSVKDLKVVQLSRQIGNHAAKAKVSQVQLMEFYRILLVDVVNCELCQVEEEISFAN